MKLHLFSSIKAQKFRVALIVSALFISAASLIYSHYLTRALYVEEVGKMDVWAQAMRSLATADEHTDLNLVLKVINSNHTIPVIVTDAHGTILTPSLRGPTPCSNSNKLQPECGSKVRCCAWTLPPPTMHRTSIYT